MFVGTGRVNLKDVYFDGSKIEANSNRYTFVWGKSIKCNKEKIESNTYCYYCPPGRQMKRI